MSSSPCSVASNSSERAAAQIQLSISVQGVIGACKSTFTNLLVTDPESPIVKRGLTAAVPEPSKRWREDGMLQDFYEDPKTNGAEFQYYTMITRVQAYQAVVEANPDVVNLVLDRDIHSDKNLFAMLMNETGNMRAFSYKVYNTLWPAFRDLWPRPPDLFVWLDTDMAVVMNRIQERGRQEEQAGVPEEYNRALHKRHEEFLVPDGARLTDGTPVPVLRIYNQGDLRDNLAARREAYRLIDEALIDIGK